jgi:hypothetical protein
MLLILRFEHLLPCYQYWALIPPAAAKDRGAAALDQMCLIHLIDRDDLIMDYDKCANNISREEEAEVEEDMQQYFAESLPAALGQPGRYNPSASPSNKIDRLVGSSNEQINIHNGHDNIIIDSSRIP